MSAIKKFFEKQKLERKFKKAGPGHSLAASSNPSAGASYQPPVSPRQVSPAKPQTDEQRRAAEAALARANRPETGGCINQTRCIRGRKEGSLDSITTAVTGL